MKLSQMHPDQSGIGATPVPGSPLPQFDRSHDTRPRSSQYSWQSGTTRQPVDDIHHASGSVAPLCREVAFPGCIFAGGLIEKLQEPLAAEEQGDIENAVLKRQREFIAGRTSARIALAQMGYTNLPIPRSVSRAPLWPRGVVGSISHNSHYCVAVTSSSNLYRGIGIDVESPSGLPAEFVGLICTPKEMEFLFQRPEPVRGKLAKLFFSAKESVFKCVFPIFREQLEFDDVEITFDLEARTFQAALKTGTRETVQIIDGRFASSEHLLLTFAVLPRSVPRHLPQSRPAVAAYRESACQSVVE